jgi:hypothetical protein
MCDGSTMKGIRAALARHAGSFDPDVLSASDARAVLDDAIATENMAATIKSLAAKRVADTKAWRRDGHRSAAHQLARRSGTSVSKARQALDTAERLRELPELEAGVRSGEISPAQAAPIADAATADPSAERRLVDMAKQSSLGELADECDRTKAAADPDPDARHRAIHAGRYLRKRRCADGAGELTYRSTVEEVAEIFSVVQGFAQRVFAKARSESRREPEEAYLADGLLNAVRAGAAAGKAKPKTQAAGPAGADEGTSTDGTGEEHHGGHPESGSAGEGGTDHHDGDEAGTDHSGTDEGEPAGTVEHHAGASVEEAEGDESDPGPALAPPVRPAKVVVPIDWDAFLRGWPVGDEVCEIAGVGPVPVSAVKAMVASGDAFLAAVVTKGTDVVNVAHLGRQPTAAQRSALEWRNPTCAVSGCNASVRLEIDHRHDWADHKITLLSLLDRLCRHHHALKTRTGWALVAGTGKRAMVAPGDPRHPRHPPRARAGPAPVAEGA